MTDATIAAIATPTGRGGIGIIRVSGAHALRISAGIFRLARRDERGLFDVESHRLYYGHIVDDGGQVVDEVLFVFMKGPRSYTAEDVVEIQSHASPIVLRKILDLLLKKGAELAAPGEFTKRAYLNGRIDLTQAEAVIDIINARTSSSLDIAVSQVSGELKGEITSIRNTLLDLHKKIEAVLDFPDDVGEILETAEVADQLKHFVLARLQKLTNNFEDSNIFRDGIRLVIAGPPNSGKSSLLNRLLNKEKSIVTSVPGTTRDIVDDILNIDGIPLVVADTAGIHRTDDIVENIGIERAFSRMTEADLVLAVFDITSENLESELATILERAGDSANQIIVVLNKTDLHGGGDVSSQWLTEWGGDTVSVSVLENRGVDLLKEKIVEVILKDLPEDRSSLVPNVRHNALIGKSMENVSNVLEALDQGISWEFAAIDIAEAIDSLGEVVGVTCSPDILDEIFSSFCIGK